MAHNPRADGSSGHLRQRPEERRLVVTAAAADYARCIRRNLVLAFLAALLVASGSAAAQEGSGPGPVFTLLAASETDPATLRAAAAALTPAGIRAATLAGQEADLRGAGGITALMLAVWFNPEPQVARALLDAGADVTARDAHGWSPVMLAAAFNPNPAVAQVLLAAGAALREDGVTAPAPFLHLAGHHAVLDRVSALLQRGPLPVASISGGETALMAAAAYNGSPAMVETLTGAGAEVRRADSSGATALMAAVLNPNAAVIRVLLDAGSDIHARDERGRTALIGAAGFSPDPAVIRLLLHAGADPLARDERGWNALMTAAAHNRNPGAAQLLLDAGADLHARNDNGRTVLMEAAENNPSPEVIRLLLGAGAEIEVRDSRFSMPPLMFAAWHNESATVVEALLHAGADVHSRDRDGWTALMHAAAFNINPASPAIIAALLAAGSEIDAVDDVERYTALMWAANHGEIPEVVHALLDAGADPAIRGANGEVAATLMASNEPLRRTSAYRRLLQ